MPPNQALSHLSADQAVLNQINKGPACVEEQCPPDHRDIATNPSPQFDRTHKIYGVWADLLARGGNQFLNQQTPDLELGESYFTASEIIPVWWRIDLWALEVSRSVALATFVPPLTRGQIVNQGQRFSRLKARITFETTQERVVDVDIGTGIRLSMLASSVRVNLLLPRNQGYRLVGDQLPVGVSESGEGLVTDTLASGSAYQSESPHGVNQATYTQFVAFGTTDPGPRVIPIPSAAKFLTVYANPPQPGNPALQWFQAVASTFPSPVGEVVIPPSRFIESVAVPQNCDSLVIPGPGGGGAGVNFGYELIWHLEF